MRILKMPSYCFPERISSSHLSEDLSEAYSKAGFCQVLYAPTPTRGISAEIRNKYKKIKYEELDGGKMIIHRFAMFREGKNPILRALRYTFICIAQYFKASRAKDIDVISAGSTPPIQGLLCGAVQKRLSRRCKRHVPFVYSLQDVFPDSLVNAGMTHRGSLLWKIGRKVENFTYRHADKIIVISEDIKRNIMDKGVPEDKIVIIPNWVDTEATHPIPREENRLFDELELDRNGYYVVYAGNVGTAQGIDTLLDAASALTDSPEIQFVIFGGGSRLDTVKERAAALPNVRVFPLMPPERISEVYSLGDLSVVACKKGVGGGAIPSKTYSIMATGTPILLSFDEGTELWRLVTEQDCGIAAPAGDAAELKQCILQAHEQRETVAQKGIGALEYVRAHHSKERMTAKHVELLNAVAGKPAHSEV